MSRSELASARCNTISPFPASLVRSRPGGVPVAGALFLDVEFLHVWIEVESLTYTLCSYIALHI